MDYRQSHISKAGTKYDKDLSSGDFNEYMAIQEKLILNKIVDNINPTENHRYLDFACGSGRILETVSPYYKNITAIDVSASMMEEATKKVPDAIFHQFDITKENQDLGKFDLITSFRFFGNAENDLRKEVLASLTPLLSGSGHLIINNHRNPSSLLAILSGVKHGMTLTNTDFIKQLTSSGLKIERIIPIGLWILRHKWTFKSIWSTRIAKLAEEVTRLQIFAKYAPDAVFVCRLS